MKKIYTPILLLALFVFVMLFALPSCDAGKADTGGDNSSGTAESPGDIDSGGEPEIPDNLPEMDFGGYDFRVYMRHDGRNTDFFAESENGDLINDAVYKRNKIVEDRFNINIVPVIYTNEFDTSAEKAILAGSDAYDIMAMHGVHSFSYAKKGLVIDWLEDMPYVNFAMPWWRDDITKGFAAFGNLYCVTGDMSHLSFSSVMCMLFNKTLFQNLNLDYPYEEVKNGTWTIDRLFSINKNSGADLNGDGAMTPEADRYGMLIFNEWSYPIAVLYCGGDRVVSLDSENVPVLSLYNDRTVDIYDKFFDMFNHPGAAYMGPMNAAELVDIFKEGRSLFGGLGMGSIIAYRDMEDEIGILPLPKYDVATPKYYAPSEAGTNLFTVPVTAPNTERTSIIVEALCAEGHKKVIPVYYEKALKTKYSRDDESESMLDYIKDGIVYDYGYYNNSLTEDLAFVGQRLVTTKNTNFTSFYEKFERKIQKNIEKLK